MIEITQEMTQKMSATNRLMCQEMLRRGWKVHIPYWYVSDFYITRSDGRRLHVFSSTPPTVSYATGLMTNNKYATAKILEGYGVQQLPTVLATQQTFDEACDFMQMHHPVVVKPLDGSHGHGITVDVAEIRQLEAALAFACDASKTGKAILQKQFLSDGPLHDIRILIINGVYIGAIHRVPARVKGDGCRTVEALIDAENAQPWRGEAYKTKLSTIDVARARTFLGEVMTNVPTDGEYVTVAGVANYGAGGELIDVTDETPEWMRDEAIEIARVLELPVAGVDYIVSRALVADMPKGIETATVVEVNKSPSLCIHDEPTVGMNRQATVAYIDYLASL